MLGAPLQQGAVEHSRVGFHNSRTGEETMKAFAFAALLITAVLAQTAAEAAAKLQPAPGERGTSAEPATPGNMAA